MRNRVFLALMIAASARTASAVKPDTEWPNGGAAETAAPTRQWAQPGVETATVDTAEREAPADELCSGALDNLPAVVAEEEPGVPASTFGNLAEVSESDVDRDVQALVEALGKGEISSIQVVTDYQSQTNSYFGDAGSPVMQGKLSGPGVDESLKSFDAQMKELAVLMAFYTPESLEADQNSWGNWFSNFLGRKKEQAVALTAGYQSNSNKIALILDGLSRARVALLFDNKALQREINRLIKEQDDLLKTTEIWKLRDLKFKAVAAEMEERLRQEPENRRLKSQIRLVKTQLLLPIAQTIKNLNDQYDLFDGAILAHIGQQEQNNLIVTSGYNLQQAATKVLPTLVRLAVTTARAGTALSLQEGTRKILVMGMQSTVKQMNLNQIRTEQLLSEGAIPRSDIEAFRNGVIGVLETMENGQLRIYDRLQGENSAREAVEAQQRERINAMKNRTPIDLLPDADDVPQIGSVEMPDLEQKGTQ